MKVHMLGHCLEEEEGRHFHRVKLMEERHHFHRLEIA